MVDPVELEHKIGELLDEFYKRRSNKINELKLRDTLARKNPYLYRALGLEKAADIIEEILRAYMSSSDEGIFGDAFFEPLAKFASCGDVAPSEGTDVVIQTESTYTAVAVKSGPNVFNVQSRNRQIEEFNKLRNRLIKLHKQFDPVVGYCYGKKRQGNKSNPKFRELAGQAFWEEITGDPYFYVKIIQLMRDKPQQHLPQYQKAFNDAVNRFTREFTTDFCDEQGSIMWEKVIRFNSGKPVKTLKVSPATTKLKPGDKLQLLVEAEYYDGSKVDVTSAADTIYKTDGQGIIINQDGMLIVASTAQIGVTAKLEVAYGEKSRKWSVKIG